VAPSIPEPGLVAVRATLSDPGPAALAAVRALKAVPGSAPGAVRAVRAVAEPAGTARSGSRLARSRAAAPSRSARLRRGDRHAADLRLVHGTPRPEDPCGHGADLLSTRLIGEEEDREPLCAACL
jgi:hypothetical protein